MIVIPTCQYNIYYDDYGNSSKYLFDWNHVLPPFKRNGQTIGFIDVIITFNSFISTCKFLLVAWYNTKKLVLLPVLNLIINYYSPFFCDFSWLLVFVTIRKEKVKNVYFSFCIQHIPVFFKRLILVVAPCLLQCVPVLWLTDLYFYPQ